MAANAAQNSGTVIGMHTGSEGLTGGQDAVLDGEGGLAGAVQSKGDEKPLSEPEEPTVVVDAGHGASGGAEYLVIMTRETDDYMDLKERTQISIENDTDLFISVHCNYYEGGSEGQSG